MQFDALCSYSLVLCRQTDGNLTITIILSSHMDSSQYWMLESFKIRD